MKLTRGFGIETALGGFHGEMFVGEELDLTMCRHKLVLAAGRQNAILHRHPSLTAAFKVRLYSLWRRLCFLIGMMANRETTFRDRVARYACSDGSW